MSKLVKVADVDTLAAVKFVHKQIRAGVESNVHIWMGMRQRVGVTLSVQKISGIRRSLNYQAGKLANRMV